jgi:hypothetical protein
MTKPKNIAIDARFLLRKQRGMPLYVYMLCRLLPRQMKENTFYIFINKGFENKELAQEYASR